MPLRARPIEFWLGANKYTYNGDDLFIGNQKFDADLSNAPSPFAPRRQAAVPEKRTDYWRAQTLFRGLETRANVNFMEEEVRGAADCPMTDRLEKISRDMKEIYDARLSKLKTEKWGLCKSNEDKANCDAERFVKELFADQEDTSAPVVFQSVSIAAQNSVALAAEEAGLCLRRVDTFEKGQINLCPGRVPTGNLTIIGRDKQLVLVKAAEYKSMFLQAQRSQFIEHHNTIKTEHASFLRTASASASTDWNVTGRWRVNCLEMRDFRCWDDDTPGVQMNISRVVTEKGQEMIGSFLFGVGHAMFRFENPGSSDDAVTGSSANSDLESSSEEQGLLSWMESCTQQPGTDFTSATPDYTLSSSDKPSVKTPTWRYRWRGLLGSGQAAAASKSNAKLEIHFLSGGTEFIGEWNWESLGTRCFISGVKVSNEQRVVSPRGIELEWAQLDEGYKGEDEGDDEGDDEEIHAPPPRADPLAGFDFASFLQHNHGLHRNEE